MEISHGLGFYMKSFQEAPGYCVSNNFCPLLCADWNLKRLAILTLHKSQFGFERDFLHGQSLSQRSQN